MAKAMKKPSLFCKVSFPALSALLLAAGMTQTAVAANYDNWPERTVTMVIPFAPGGPTDVTGRLLAEELAKIWGQSVIVENRAGAGGTIGAANTARAPKDGYTIILGVTGSHGIAGSLYKDLAYDPAEDFEAVSKVVIYPNAIFAHPSLPADNLEELIELVKENSDYGIYGTDGNGTASHLTMELLAERAGIDLDAVQYKGSTPLITDVVGGFTQYGITGLPSVEQHLSDGNVKLIAITTDQDYSNRGLKTIAEQGFPGFAAAPWSGIFAPKGTPKPVVEKMANDIKVVLSSEEITKKLNALGLTPMPLTLEEFEADLEKERESWAKAVEIADINP